jgi:phosphoribosyl 1,2-cyclic phosphodiesterase
MKVIFWGTRGSLPTPGPETVQFGGNTSCVQVLGDQGTVLVLDAGSGLRRLGTALPKTISRVDLLLSHLHMDHIQGLGFFLPLYDPGKEVHLWGPASTTLDLRSRLNRYLSPPLFPVHLRDLPCKLFFHNVPSAEVEIGEFRVSSWLLCHPGPTVGYRISDGKQALAYIPDHEPVLGLRTWTESPDWVSGFSCAREVDLLIHDAQYNSQEYAQRMGWGHSSISDTIHFARLSGVKHLVAFHHDPSHDDAFLAKMIAEATDRLQPGFPVSTAAEGAEIGLG